jgi:YesN/AraC family two-component response regulator
MLFFFFWLLWYELKERLPVAENDSIAGAEDKPYDIIDKLWVDLTHLLVEQHGWRNPELSLQSLSEELGSNRTYVGEAFKKFTGSTFSEYIARRRIEYVVTELKRNPKANLQALFSYAGFRQRSTAYRNFQKITGVTLTEYLENIK